MTTIQRAELRRRRREKTAQQIKPGQWFPVDPTREVHECNVCYQVKVVDEFGKTNGQWRSARCKVCSKQLGDRARSEAKLALAGEIKDVKPGRVRELWFCSACHAQGIISPVPRGHVCPWHKPEFLERRANEASMAVADDRTSQAAPKKARTQHESDISRVVEAVAQVALRRTDDRREHDADAAARTGPDDGGVAGGAGADGRGGRR